jgi:predicted nucleic acid-binding Zn finger protein
MKRTNGETKMLIAEKTTYTKVYRSALFTAYNNAKHAAKTVHKLEIKRVHKAIGLAVSEVLIGKVRPYTTDLKSCNCPDYYARKNGLLCKHIIAKMIIKRANEKISAERSKSVTSKIDAERKSQEEFKNFMDKVRAEQDAKVRRMEREKALPVDRAQDMIKALGF